MSKYRCHEIPQPDFEASFTDEMTVQAFIAPGRGIEEAPEDNKQYCRKNGDWEENEGTALELGTSETTAYRGDLGQTAYNHSQNNHFSKQGYVFIAYDEEIDDYYSSLYSAINTYSHVVIGSDRDEIFIISQPLLIPDNVHVEINCTLKITDGDETTITEDIPEGQTWFKCADPSIFSVGQWVCITDNAKLHLYKVYRGWSGYITDINGNTITLDSASFDSYTMSESARVGHFQPTILCYQKSNIKISGRGVVDNNRYNQMAAHPAYLTEIEDQRTGAAIAIWECDNIEVDIEATQGAMHSFIITGRDADNRSSNILIRRLKATYGHDKSVLIRMVDNIEIFSIEGSEATWEDGVMFYSAVSNARVNTIIAKNNHRYGVGWNSSVNEDLNISNIYTEGNYEWGLYLSSKQVNIVNATCKDPVHLNAATYDCQDVNICNFHIIDVDMNNHIGGLTSGVLRLTGNIKECNITNLKIDGCTGIGIQTVDSDGVPEDINIVSGGIYNHTGEETELATGTDIEFVAFRNADGVLLNEGYNPFTGFTTAQQALLSASENWEGGAYTGDQITNLIPGTFSVDDSYIYFVTQETVIRIARA